MRVQVLMMLLAGAAAAQPANSPDANRLTDLRNAGVSIGQAQICRVPNKRIVLVAQKIILNAGRNLTEQQAADATQALNAGITAGRSQTLPLGADQCDQIVLDFTLLAAKSGVALDDWKAAGQGP